MNERKGSFTDRDYRYGYNGKENDDEVKGESNQQDYGFRVYDPRVGRFLSVDPLADAIPAWSPYNYVLNNPVKLIDPDGRAPSDGDGTENEYIRTWNATTNSYDTKQISNIGGNEFDIIHTVHGKIPEVGTTITTDVVFNETNNGVRISPGNFVEIKPFMPASGALQTLDGADDPIFNIITLGQGVAWSKAGPEGFEVLGFSAFRQSGDNIVSTAGNNLLGKARDNLLAGVQNIKLKNIINDLFRATAKVGGGSSMDAYRFEMLTGATVGGKSHGIKLVEYRTALQKLWSNRSSLSQNDRAVVKHLITDIQNALSGN